MRDRNEMQQGQHQAPTPVPEPEPALVAPHGLERLFPLSVTFTTTSGRAGASTQAGRRAVLSAWNFPSARRSLLNPGTNPQGSPGEMDAGLIEVFPRGWLRMGWQLAGQVARFDALPVLFGLLRCDVRDWERKSWGNID
jgi:hypothetical protein